MAKITGSLQDDTIVGAYLAKDSLNGAAGNDVLYGYGDGSGIGGTPPPYLPDSGGPADNDTLSGALGADTLFGGGGNDRLDGGAGADSMDGGDQDDIYFVDNNSDQASETNSGALGGTDLVISSVGHVLGNGIENLKMTGKAAGDSQGNNLDNWIIGNAGNNGIGGGAGNDTIDGGASPDFMGGGAGDDVVVIDNAGDLLLEFNGEGIDTIRWMRNVNLDLNDGAFDNYENAELLGSANINLTGDANNNGLGGNSGANAIDGGAGADTMAGGAGNDKYYVDNALDQIFESAGGGFDQVFSSVNAYLSPNVENLTLTGAAVTANGNDLANFIRGNDMDNVIEGVGGADTMAGGKGSDYYTVDTTKDKIIELAGEGTLDTVTAYFSNYVLPAGVERLFLFSIGAPLNGSGNSGNNELYGTVNTNILDGKGGADTMDGASDNDILIVDNIGDVTFDSVDGYDKVLSSASHAIGAGIDELVLTGKAAINGTGNDLSNRITGNDAGNILTGGAGVDTLIGGGGKDTMNGGADGDLYVVDNAGDRAEEADDSSIFDDVLSSVSYTLHWTMDNLVLTGAAALSGTGNDDINYIEGNAGANKLFGLGGSDTLSGKNGNDTLDGGAGSDSLVGGSGNDRYIVESISDVLVEHFAGGVDTVIASSGYALGANLENLTLINGIVGNGNELNNLIVGNETANGLDGAAGADTMVGGLGSDFYQVDNAGDKVVELAGKGQGDGDFVTSSVSYVLPAEVEALQLTGSAFLNGTGNAKPNSIIGNDGNNILDGKGGADTMEGGSGSDTYRVDNVGDQTSDLGGLLFGTDHVISSVGHAIGSGIENLTLTGTKAMNGAGNNLDNLIIGNAGANLLQGLDGSDTLIGGAGNDRLIGDAGIDRLIGGAGFDTLVGGANPDIFAFDKTSSGKDLILGFEAGFPGDIIYIAEMLTGYAPGVSNAEDFVRIAFVDGAITLQVDANGLAGGSKFTDLVAFDTYPNVTIDSMIATGHLVLEAI